MSVSSNNDGSGGAGVSRRSFIREVVAAGSGLAAVAALGSAHADTQAEANAAQGSESRGYHETQHIRDYYRTAAL